MCAEDVQENPALPRVLIIGDSISMGYTQTVQKTLKDKAMVMRHKGNAGPTIRGLTHLDTWLGDTKWDLIHFNWGLWDMYGWEYAKDPRTPADYEKRLEILVTRLEKTGAKLIWGTTTPRCPAAEKTMLKRFDSEVIISAELEKDYLDTALKVMKKHHVVINDLHGFIAADRDKYALGPDDVHYTAQGYEALGKQVAKVIEQNL
jgi:acyl-CoA thioesterase-1